MKALPFLPAAALCAVAATLHAHPGHDGSASSNEPIFFLAQAGPPGARPSTARSSGKAENRVSITVEGDYRVIRSNGWPDHTPGAFPRKGNPNTATPQDYTFRVPAKPVAATETSFRGGWFFGVAVNGVPFEPGTGETWNNDPRSGWRYEAATGFLDLGLDEHNAHVQPTGAYHYHALPTGLVERLGGDGRKMLLIGWAADGFPIYASDGYANPKDASSELRVLKSSYRLKSGARPKVEGGPSGNYDGRFTQDFEYVAGSGDLDECNGRYGVTPEFPQGTYAYFTTKEFPFLPRLFRGTPDESFGKNGPGPRGPGGPMAGGPGGGPPGRRGTGLPAGILKDGAAGEPIGNAPQGARGGEQAGRGPAGGEGPRGMGEGGRGGMGRLPVPPVITALDTNNDGTIDAAELANATASLRKLDKNGDGKLTGDELRPAGMQGPPNGGGPGGEGRGGEGGRRGRAPQGPPQ